MTGTRLNGPASSSVKARAEEARTAHAENQKLRDENEKLKALLRAHGIEIDDVTDDWKDRPPWEHPLEAEFPVLDFKKLPALTERQWAVDNWLPMLETVGFGGPAGEGKTLMASMFATAAALGTGCLGLPFAQMNAALVLSEDRVNDAHLRQRDICRAWNFKLSDLDGRLLVLPRRDCEYNYLAIFDRDGELHLTTYFAQLLVELEKFQAKFVVLDGRSDVFRGNQNDEGHARQFVRKVCDRIARKLKGVVLLIYHPSRKGRTDGTGESGSVQWDSAFRARLVLEPPGNKDEPETRTLIRKKSNFSAKNEKIQIRWEKGVFFRTDEPAPNKSALDLMSEAEKAKRVFLKLLDDFEGQNRPVSCSQNAGNYAPRLFSERKGANGVTKAEFERAMETLFEGEVITNQPLKRGGTRIIRVEAKTSTTEESATQTLTPSESGTHSVSHSLPVGKGESAHQRVHPPHQGGGGE